MRKLKAWNVMTLDGFFEGTEPWTLDFHELVWGKELEAVSGEQLQPANMLLFGRRTYEGMLKYWSAETGPIAEGMNALPKAVVSHSLERADWNNTTLLKGDAVEQVRDLKAGEGGDIYVFGSADLLATLLAYRLVDEYRICIAPVILGKGNRLFKSTEARLDLELQESLPLPGGGLLLNYVLRAA